MRCIIVLLVLVELIGAGEFMLGLDVSGLNLEQIAYFLPPNGGAEALFAKSVAPFEMYEGVYLWSSADERLKDLFEILPFGGKIIVEDSYTPRCLIGWYSGNHFGESNRRGANSVWYANKMAAMVYRWQPGGVVPFANGCGVSEWGLWNEPDGIGLMCSPGESAIVGLQAYFDIASSASTLIHSADPNAIVISGGFLQTSSWRPMQSGQTWLTNFEPWMCQIFGRSDYSPPVEFLWDNPPDVLHWHPYDAMEYDPPCVFPENESHYDPLVIDTDDLMCQNRPSQLPEVLGNLFSGANEPDWHSMPQYALEYVPTYSMSSWRAYSDPSEISDFEEKYFSEWRANFQLTTTLCLIESELVDVLAPQVPQSQWWVEDWNPFGLWNVDTPDQTGDGYTYADDAWRELTLQLRERDFLSSCNQFSLDTSRNQLLSVMLLDRDTPSIKRWLFSATSSEGRLHVMRTYRTAPDDDYHADTFYSTRIPVCATTDYVIVTDMYGNLVSTIFPENGYALVSVNGFVTYINEHFSQSEIQQAVVSDFSIGLLSNAIIVTCSPNVDTITLFDLSGRCVNSIRTNQIDRTYRINTSILPSGMYMIATSNSSGAILISKKVVII